MTAARGGSDGCRWDVAVVLGAALRPDGSPSHALERRLMHGVRLLHEGAAPRLLLSGGVVTGGESEAAVMARLAARHGVAEGVLLREERSRSTWENARECAAILRREGFLKVLLVTDGYHAPRALLAFRAHGIVAGAAPAPGARQAMGLLRWALLVGREGAALAWYAARFLGRQRGRRASSIGG